MSIVSLSGISLDFGAQTIFDNMSFSLENNSKIGLVGKNGCGKTTLFNLITQKLRPEKGQLHIARNAQISYLTQEPELDDSKTIEQSVLESRADYVQYSQDLKRAEELLSQHNTQENLDNYTNAIERFEAINGYNFRTEMKLVLTSLQFPLELWSRTIKNFSGGEKTRIQLAKILLQPFDLLLLDEPTNHLDIEMIYWLENYLSNLGKPYMIISHDRKFLDKTVTKIAEIEHKAINWYKGNFSFYLKEREERKKLQDKLADKQDKQVKKMKDQIKQYRIWGNARDSEVMFKRAKELEKRLDKIQPIENVTREKALSLNFKDTKRSGNNVFVLENLKFGFDNLILAENVNLRINYQDRIALLGKNGCGKSSFLKLLLGEIAPLGGTAQKGASLQVGYYDQMHLKLDSKLSVKETMWQMAPLETRGYVLGYLAKFGFTGDDVEKKVSLLSGGEKARLYLAKIIHKKPNFLILDEPTNHLDINMIAYLETALENFSGTIIFVSHDRYFIDKIAKKKWIFQNNTIEETDKDLDELFFQKKVKTDKPEQNRKPQKEKKINPYIINKLQEKITKTETKLIDANKKLDDLHNKFADPNFLKKEKEIISVNKQIKLVENKIENLKLELDEFETEFLELTL
jgi:ATP-binding cassette subfamily F protein 3